MLFVSMGDMAKGAKTEIVEEVATSDPFADIANESEVRLYELGYHLLPTVAEESIGAEAAKVKDAIEAAGGIIMTEGFPKGISLAYPLPKVIANKRTFYESAHFGWFKFQMGSDKAAGLDEALKHIDTVLRFILFKTKIEKAPRAPRRMRFFGTPQRGTEKKEEASTAVPNPLSEAELEKTVEELITTDK